MDHFGSFWTKIKNQRKYKLFVFQSKKSQNCPQKNLKDIIFGTFWVILDENKKSEEIQIIFFSSKKSQNTSKKIKKKIIFGTFWVILDKNKKSEEIQIICFSVQKVPKLPPKKDEVI